MRHAQKAKGYRRGPAVPFLVFTGLAWIAPGLSVDAPAAGARPMRPSTEEHGAPALARAVTREGGAWKVPPPEIPLPRYPIARKGFRDGEKLGFEFGWQGIPAARAEIVVTEFEEGGVNKVRVTGSAQTLDWLDWIWKMNDRIETVFLAESLSPVRFLFQQKEKTDRIDTTMIFRPEEKVALSTRVKNGNPVERIFPYALSYDPITAAMLLRSVDLEVGEEKVAEILNGKNRYIVRVKVAGMERIKVRPGEFSAYRLEPTIQPVHIRPGVPPKIKRVVIWLSADERRIPLRIESEVLVGHVYGEWIE